MHNTNKEDKQNTELGYEEKFDLRVKKSGFENILLEDHEEALIEHEKRGFSITIDELEELDELDEIEEEKSNFWRNFFSIVAATIILIVGYIIWAINVDDSGFTKINNRLSAIENRIGVFSPSDKASISDKLTTLGKNQVTLQNDLAATVADVNTNIKTIKSVRTIAYNNKKNIGILKKKTNALAIKVNTKDTRIKTLQSLVAKLKIEECSRLFRMNDSDLCK